MDCKTPEEADSVDNPLRGLAPKQCIVGDWQCRHEGTRLFGLYQGGGYKVEFIMDSKFRTNSCFLYRPAPTVWGEKLPFNTICGEYASPAGGWVHAVGFSPSGDILAFASK